MDYHSEFLCKIMNVKVISLGETTNLRPYGVLPVDRIKKQVNLLSQSSNNTFSPDEIILIVDPRLVVSDDVIARLVEVPFRFIRDEAQQIVAVSVPSTDFENGKNCFLKNLISDSRWQEINWMRKSFDRKLRKKQSCLLYKVGDLPLYKIEYAMFKHVYKGVTDVITKYIWPYPAFVLVWLLARLKCPPNFVTTISIFLTFLAGFLFWEGSFKSGLFVAWIMTLLDTVDGKLARITQQSSRLGNILDHATDIIHPPFWWMAIAFSLIELPNNQISNQWINSALLTILVTYVVGRLVEMHFKYKFGFNQYLWNRADSILRLFIARRNIILLILSIFILYEFSMGFLFAATWCLITISMQVHRYGQALALSRQGKNISSWFV